MHIDIKYIGYKLKKRKTRFKYEITDIRKQKYRKKDMEI
jgi:hypothetical protein